MDVATDAPATVPVVTLDIGDERISLTDHGEAVVYMEQAHQTMNDLERHQAVMPAVLKVVRFALIVSGSWRACYEGCVCVRCELDQATRELVAAVMSARPR